MKTFPEIIYINCEDQDVADQGRACVRLEDYKLLEKEVEDMEKWIDDLQCGMWINCVYCGHRYGPNAGPNTKDFNLTMRKSLEKHIAECSKHPLSTAKAEIERLRKALERISRYDSYHQEWPNDIYINAPPEELATFVLAGDDYLPERAGDANES